MKVPHDDPASPVEVLNARCRAFRHACRNQSFYSVATTALAIAWFPAALGCAWLGRLDLLMPGAVAILALFVAGGSLALLWTRRRNRLYRSIKAAAARLSRAGFSVYKQPDAPLLGAFRRGIAPAGRQVLQLEKLSALEFASLLAQRDEPHASVDRLFDDDAPDARSLETIGTP